MVKELDADCAKYLLTLLSTCPDFKPDYHKLAAEAGLANANKAQVKFKGIVERGGFSLTNGRVIGPSTAAGDDAVPKIPTTPKPRANKATAKTPGSSAKKRKLSTKETSDDGTDEEEDEKVKHGEKA